MIKTRDLTQDVCRSKKDDVTKGDQNETRSYPRYCILRVDAFYHHLEYIHGGSCNWINDTVKRMSL